MMDSKSIFLYSCENSAVSGGNFKLGHELIGQSEGLYSANQMSGWSSEQLWSKNLELTAGRSIKIRKYGFTSL